MTTYESPMNFNSDSSIDPDTSGLYDAPDLGVGDQIINFSPISVKFTQPEYPLIDPKVLSPQYVDIPLSPEVASKVGLSLLPCQSELFSHRKGSAFNLLVAGQVGVGKTSFVNTLFATELVSSTEVSDTPVRAEKFRLVENGFCLNLTVADTPAFGGRIDNSGTWLPVCEYIDYQFKMHLLRENQPLRSQMTDSRVHCCVYVISASTGITPLDLEAMKSLHTRVNLIPVVSKSDCLTKGELEALKTDVKELLECYDITICDFLADEDLKDTIQENIPFSLVSSNSYHYNTAGGFVRGREYDWGLVEVDNKDHCDFTMLREILVSQNMLDFILSTESHFERYRTGLLQRAMDIFCDRPVVSGLDELQHYHRLTLANYSELIEEDGPYLQYMTAKSKHEFYKEVKNQQNRFRQWKRALSKKQQEFNDEVQWLHKKYLKLLEGRDSPQSTPSEPSLLSAGSMSSTDSFC